MDPYLSLGSQAAGVLLAAWVLGTLLGLRPNVPNARLAVGTVAMLALSLGFAEGLWGGGNYLLDLRRANATITEADSRERCLHAASVPDQVPFVRWLRTNLPGDARYRTQTAPRSLDGGCLGFNHLPQVPATTVAGAEWLIFAQGIPPEWQRRIEHERQLPRSRRSVLVFDATRAVAKVR